MTAKTLTANAAVAALQPFLDEVADDMAHRPILVWAMNDRMNEAESRRQLESFKGCGYGGVMVMPWGSLPYEFMSDEWLDRVGEILHASRELELEVWIWDDWIFGSGTAAGRVTAREEFRAKTLRVTVDMILEPGQSAGFVLPERAEVCGIFPIDKFGNPVGDTEILGIEPNQPVNVTAPERRRLIVIGWDYISGMQHTTRTHSLFLDPEASKEACDIYVCEDAHVWSVDMMNPEATGVYLQEIHQRYHDRFADYFGGTLKGFFYDEPKASSTRPWTTAFLDRFAAMKGYCLREHLVPMLTDFIMEGSCFNEQLRPEKIHQVEADYHDVWTSLVAEGFYREIQNWCREHDVIATGHPMGDNNLEVSELCGGAGIYFKNMAFSGMPGVDVIWSMIEVGRFCDSSRLAGSRAAVCGKPQAMSETFAVFGHGLHLDQMRYVMENQIIRGVSKFFNKLTNYNREKSFHFHPPDLSDYNPLINQYGRLLHDRITTLNRVMRGGRPAETVGLYIPLQNYYRHDEAMARQLAALSKKLAYNQIEFDLLCDQDVMNLRTSGGTIVGVNGREYLSILVPANARMNGNVVDAFKALAKDANGRVVCPGNPGTAVPPATLTMDLETYIDQCRGENSFFELLPRDLPISSRGRIAPDGTYVCLLLNESLQTIVATLKSRTRVNLFEVDPDSGETCLLGQPYGKTGVNLTFLSSESKLLVIDVGNSVSVVPRETLDNSASVPIDNWQLELPDGTIVKLDPRMPSWHELGWAEYCGFMRYCAEFSWEGQSSATLDLGTVHYAATVSLDGEKVGDCVFTPFRLRLDTLDKGKHTLEVAVLNTLANTVFGSDQRIADLEKAFKGTYAPIYKKLDMQKLRSGLFGPVSLIPEVR